MEQPLSLLDVGWWHSHGLAPVGLSQVTSLLPPPCRQGTGSNSTGSDSGSLWEARSQGSEQELLLPEHTVSWGWPSPCCPRKPSPRLPSHPSQTCSWAPMVICIPSLALAAFLASPRDRGLKLGSIFCAAQGSLPGVTSGPNTAAQGAARSHSVGQQRS